MIDGGFLEEWQTQRAPEIAIKYWKMDEKATIRDLILVIRADEDHHREVSTQFAHNEATTISAPQLQQPRTLMIVHSSHRCVLAALLSSVLFGSGSGQSLLG